jgi:hypothetical protein
MEVSEVAKPVSVTQTVGSEARAGRLAELPPE